MPITTELYVIGVTCMATLTFQEILRGFLGDRALPQESKELPTCFQCLLEVP